ncbi:MULTISPECIES: hypothetical protein [Sphingomonadales]|jgi:hypothetical protein|uniref:Uncharacterized protein n=5 Tax=Sphingomonadaceae TaxID=41297 RepID=A0A1E1F8E9_9SPHN|nr:MULTISPECIES: hypothetical protein [Sphingomonadaceae]EPR17137.1 hypothetical protein M527_17460 [Sphingobium indicum IP26]MBW7950577.1 hypothetical protein [Pseudorhodoplanes sp.]EQB07737.1 hypothetical protein L286_02895 [Sphingobium sp. HDIP04]KER34530.1 hypothetical protein AL00_20505 [Sphingobium indicum F2]MCB4860632.1 hypothetical protein [Sphingobium sp. PNB]
MFQQDLFAPPPARRTIGIPDIVRTIAEHSARPRYTFMVLDLISRVARANGQAGPLVRDGEALVPIREWLATAIAPSGARYHQRRATAGKVRAALAAKGELPADTAEAERIVEAQVSERIRDTGMTAISRAVSELVRAGLIERHYQGFLVDHENRGAQRHAVYTITPAVRAALHPNVATSEHQRDFYIRGMHGQPRAAVS